MSRQNSGLDALTIPRQRLTTQESPPTTYWLGTVYTCNVLIKFENHRSIEARSFEFYPKSCIFKSGEGRTVLEHHFSELLSSGKYHPWRHAVVHDPFTVAFTVTEAREFRILVDGGPLNESPKYEFRTPDDYALFNTQFCGKGYLGEFVPKEIDSNIRDGKSHSSVIKVWEESGVERECSVTLPVLDERKNIKFPSIPFRWFKCEEYRSSVFVSKVALKLTLYASKAHSPGPVMMTDRARRRSSLLIRGRSFVGSAASSSNGSEELPFAEPELTKLRERYGHFVVTFSNTDDCRKFRQMHEERLARHDIVTASPVGTPMLSPSPTPDQPQTEIPVDSPFALTPPRPVLQVESVQDSPMPLPLNDMLEESATYPELKLPPSASPIWPEDMSIHARFLDVAGKDLCRQCGPAVANTASDAGYLLQHDDIYKTLGNNEIRLLLIRPGSYDDPLSCSLQAYPLSGIDDTSYEAVSYCWGRVDQTKDIMISASHSFKVSKHLWEGLRRLRLQSHERWVWIDAVCINQSDIGEKNQQIPLMRRIYESARRTLIWIGDIGMDGKNCVRTVWAENDQQVDVPTLCFSGSMSKDLVHGVEDIKSALKRFYDEICKSGSMEVWWKRLWVIQEYHFSKKPPIVYVGFHSMNWKHFADMMKNITEPDDQLAPFHRLGTREHRTLFDLLCSARSFHCNDPRDRIYGLLSMQSPPTIEPDYSKSVLKVFEETCLHLIHESRSVDVLLDNRADRTRWGPKNVHDVMPTWMPDLQVLLSRDIVQINESSAGTGQHGRTASASLIRYISGQKGYDVPSLLSVRGIKFERISRRTTKTDFARYFDKSPSGSLVYYSAKRRGYLLDTILNKLQYSSTTDTKFDQLERRPYLSQLMLDYVFENKRSFVGEHQRRMERVPNTAIHAYKAQREKDVAFVHNKPKDVKYVRDRWQMKIDNAELDIFIPERLRDLLNDHTRRDRENIMNDFKIARDFENLFAYARTTEDKYYFIGANFDAPMRDDVLACDSVEEANQLASRYGTDESDPEYHFYNAKNRERDFFITEGGFVGLGPAKLEENDLVIVPIGSSLPWIVRGHRSGDIEYYTFVGEAVVPSIMSGDLLLQEAAVEEDINLR